MSRPTRTLPATPLTAPAHRLVGARTRPATQPARPKRRVLRWLVKWTVILSIWASVALAMMLLWFAHDLPRPEAALDKTRRPSLTLQDRSGRVFATYGDLMGESLRLADLPAWLPAAVVAVEDRRFWHHPGIDPIGITRALYVNLTEGRVVQGGSTLTQQVAKTLFLSNERTLRRKVQELLLTVWVEHSFTKQQILEIYLNRVYLGAGAWGVDAGAKMFFGVSARKLSLWQSAVLAGLSRAPSRFNPNTNAAAATARAKDVLAAMVDTGAITVAQAQAATAQIAFPPRPATAPGWFADWVADRAQSVLPANADATVRTTLDNRIQAAAETRLSALLDGAGTAANVSQGAVVVLDSVTGAVRAMVGGRNHKDSQFNRAVLARRQPGSAFKPFVWLAALERGMTPDDTVLDAPIRIGTWSPANYEHQFRGEMTVEDALAYSVNTAAVRLLMQSGGPKATIALASRLGIAGKLPNDASIALGTGEVGLLELTAAYAAFFNGGWRIVPHGLDGFGRPASVQVLDPGTAAMMSRMLATVVSRGTGRSAAVPGQTVAGKTGTTQDFRDAWFIGTAHGLLIGIWLGNDDNTPTKGVSGSGLPSKLFKDIAAAIR